MTDRLAALEQFASDMRLALDLMEDWELRSTICVALGKLDAALSSAAPAPCPECGGSKRVRVYTDAISASEEPIWQPCPHCSPQPAPSDVVITIPVEIRRATTTRPGYWAEFSYGGIRYCEWGETPEAARAALQAAALRQGGGSS